MSLKQVIVTVIYILLEGRGNNNDRFREISRPESKLKFIAGKVNKETDHVEKKNKQKKTLEVIY